MTDEARTPACVGLGGPHGQPLLGGDVVRCTVAGPARLAQERKSLESSDGMNRTNSYSSCRVRFHSDRLCAALLLLLQADRPPRAPAALRL